MPELEGFKKLESLISQTYLLNDPGIIKLLCAAVVANRLQTDPVWLCIVAGSSGGKTALLNALSTTKGVFAIDSLTTQAFISGAKGFGGKDPSLLNRLGSGILAMKDFTTILSMHKDQRGVILGQLRRLYDGEFNKSFGTGDDVGWKGKMGLIAGVTTVIYTAGREYAAMGERTLLYKLIQPDRMAVSRRALKNVASIDIFARRSDINEAVRHFLDEEVKIPTTLPILTPEFEEELISLSDLTTRARSPVERNWSSARKEIIFVHDPEMPVRFATQLINLAYAMRIMKSGDELDDIEKNILYKIALDSITLNRRIVLQKLTKYTESDTAGMATELAYPTDTVRMWLEDLNALNLVRRRKEKNKDHWRLLDSYKTILSKFDGIKMLDTSLIAKEEELDYSEPLNNFSFNDQVQLPPKEPDTLL